MEPNIQCVVGNPLRLLDDSVWVLANHKEINYSDGRSIEDRIEIILRKSTDLGSDSAELQSHINDWPSEYYLTQRRAQLLKGFDFKRSQKVLEVGCGFGTITRFLGETFDDVLAVEGSLNRARIARLRTKELKNVNVLCAPFQDIKYNQKFDIIFCVGVFEYSAIFMHSDKPFDFVLEYFKSLLTPEGVLVLAIENQFGLKYFATAREDHTNVRFDGLEGYPRYNKARTFGYDEIKTFLRKYFQSIDYYFPYPDYKTPACVLSEKIFSKVNAGELVGGIPHNRYLNYPKPLFDEKLVLLELDKNHMLPFFANSFLILAGQQKPLSVQMGSLGIYFNTSRGNKFKAITKFVEAADGSVRAQKKNLQGADKIEAGPLTWRECDDKWESGLSLHTNLIRRIREENITIDALFAPCRLWLDTLKSGAVHADGRYLIDGQYLDCIWRNAYIRDERCIFIDQEWQWKEQIDLHVLILRCIFLFLVAADSAPVLRGMTTKSLIKKIAASMGIQLAANDFSQFCRLESQIRNIVFDRSYFQMMCIIKFSLWNINILRLALAAKDLARRIIRKCKNTVTGSFLKNA